MIFNSLRDGLNDSVTVTVSTGRRKTNRTATKKHPTAKKCATPKKSAPKRTPPKRTPPRPAPPKRAHASAPAKSAPKRPRVHAPHRSAPTTARTHGGLFYATGREGSAGGYPRLSDRGQVYYYWIDHNERGEFRASVFDKYDRTGKEIFEITSIEHLHELIEDGYMSNYDDVDGLGEYLRERGIIGKNDRIGTDVWVEDEDDDGLSDKTRSVKLNSALQALIDEIGEGGNNFSVKNRKPVDANSVWMQFDGEWSPAFWMLFSTTKGKEGIRSSSVYHAPRLEASRSSQWELPDAIYPGDERYATKMIEVMIEMMEEQGWGDSWSDETEDDHSLADSLADLAGFTVDEQNAIYTLNKKLMALHKANVIGRYRLYNTSSKKSAYSLKRYVHPKTIIGARYNADELSTSKPVGLGPKGRAKHFPKQYGVTWEYIVKHTVEEITAKVMAYKGKQTRATSEKVTAIQQRQAERERRVAEQRQASTERKKASEQRRAERTSQSQARRDERSNLLVTKLTASAPAPAPTPTPAVVTASSAPKVKRERKVRVKAKPTEKPATTRTPSAPSEKDMDTVESGMKEIMELLKNLKND